MDVNRSQLELTYCHSAKSLKSSQSVETICGYTTSGIDGQSAADRLAMDSQQTRHCLAGLGLTTGQPREYLEARLLVPVMFALEPVFAFVRLFGQGWNGGAHRSPSRPASSLRLLTTLEP
jgi:hypothetical protein